MNKPARTLLIFALLLVASQGATATPASVPNDLAALKFLVGEWQGKGWIEFRPGKREQFTSAERVQVKLGGHILVIEGTHKDPAGKVVHQAFGVISYDQQKKALRFTSHLASGRSGTYEASYAKGRLTWTLKTPRFTMRYKILLDKKRRWREIGEMSTDGKRWRKFFEMTLSRKTPR